MSCRDGQASAAGQGQAAASCAADDANEPGVTSHPSCKVKDTVEVEPRLRVLLPRLVPHALECKFWQSETFLRWSTAVDLVNVFLRMAEVLLAVYLWQIFWNVTAMAALHVVLRVLMSNVYHRFRLVLVIHMRLYLMVAAIMIGREARRLPHRHPHLLPQLLHDSPDSQENASSYALRMLPIISLAVCSCLHALPPTLSFALTLPIQLTYLVNIFRLVALPFADIASHPTFLPYAQRACRTLAHLLHTHPAICNTRQAAWVLVLFKQLYFACALPLYITYITERRLKLTFLCQLRTSSTPTTPTTPTAPSSPTATNPPNTSWAIPATTPAASRPLKAQGAPHPTPTNPCMPSDPTTSSTLITTPTPALPRRLVFVRRLCFDAAALWALAAVSWQLVLVAHVPVLQYALPLDFVGGDKRWYWELLCGSDQPCCIAP